ncbi:hypothetical protein [Bradyrhizobium sp. dw_411]|uniref:hypothetical protein n=1 Tax=Bradyrhizobium sp. dw_411 TaxID=2720082 RepID=UPI001BCD0A15|nr:hypothetical protein [Bradyrhizobium sp. dw_411]
MSTSTYHERSSATSNATSPEQAGDVSRRTLLAGTAAATAVAAVGPIAGTAHAQGADINSKKDMMAFLALSSALTGVRLAVLAPEFTQNKTSFLDSDPGVDPIQVKNNYFAFVNNKDAATFGKLLQIARDHDQSPQDIIAGVNAADDTKFLARSIVLMWYLGSWYDPKLLQGNAAPGTAAFIPSEVVSATGYTQGLVWQIARAHPMGYSNLQFGYWSREPDDPNDPADRSNVGVITQTIP